MAALLLLATLAHAQERRLTGKIKTRLPDTVTVRLIAGDTVVREKQLGEDGDFDWRVKPGVYEFEARAERHAWIRRTQPLYRTRSEINITLEPGVTLRGRVVRKGVPPGKTTVEVGDRTVACERDGSFVVRNLWPRSEYLVKIHHNYGMVGEDETDLIRYRNVGLPGPEPTELTLEPDQEVRFSVQLPEGVDEVEGRLTVTGRFGTFLFHVHRGKQGQSRIFRGNRGKFYDYSARRKAAFVRVPGVARGKHRFVVSTRGCRAVTRDVVVDGVTEFAVAPDRRRGRTITMKPVQGWFEVAGLGPDTPFSFLPEGTGTLLFFSDRYLPQVVKVEISDSKEPLVLDIPLVPAPVISGKIEGIADARLTLGRAGYVNRPFKSAPMGYALLRTIHVRDGRFRISGLPPARFDIWLYDLKLATFALGTESITLDLKLPR